MTTESFTYWNSLGNIDHSISTGPWNVSASGQTFAPQLDDTQDGNSNGITAPGDGIEWPSVGGYVFIGFTAAGDPIISSSAGFGNTYVMSNNDLNGTSVSAVDTSTPYMYCFAAGTQITTANGSAAVETLSIGDAITTATGQIVPVKWVGRQTLNKWAHGPHMQPVRISAGALGDGLPHSDLTVTADHGIFIDGLVINASALVNGDSIAWVPMAELADRVIYYHIETENHDVILANGAASETFIDVAGRAAFDNYAEYLELYGTERIIPEMKHHRISSPRLLPDAIRARLGIPEAKVWDLSLTA